MKKNLIWISFLWLLTLPVWTQTNTDPAHHYLTFDAEGNARYNLSIESKKALLSGICMFKESKAEIIGSVVNEFGIKAFDIRYRKNKNKVKLMNVVGFLNKWYIRNTMKRDMKYLFQSYCQPATIDNPSYSLQQETDGMLTLKNLKHELTYTFSPLQQTTGE